MHVFKNQPKLVVEIVIQFYYAPPVRCQVYLASSLQYDLLVYVANWPQRRIHAWKTLLQARAIENQSYVVGVNRVGNDGNNIQYSGDSMIVDPLGEVLYLATGEEAVFTYTLQKDKLDEIRNHYPFWRDADLFSIEP